MVPDFFNHRARTGGNHAGGVLDDGVGPSIVRVTGPRIAHAAVPFDDQRQTPRTREAREVLEASGLAPGATRSEGAGTRLRAEDADPFRLCFERDLDRIHHSRPFRRLAGKCQVFIAPDDDHIRTRMTHAIEVAQVAVSIARPLRLNVALVEAAAIGHDCGHGPGGHASEGALSSFVEGGYHHAVYGADVVLAPLNLCVETLDAIRNHSWNRDTPATPEGEVVAWADRIAYVCHDFEDAVNAQVVRPDDLPPAVREIIGTDRRTQLHRLITSITHASADAGFITMGAAEASALAAFRDFNFERIYLRPESADQAERVARVITSLTAYFADHPEQVEDGMIRSADADAVATAVRYVSGMTDRYLLRVASQFLGWDDSKLPTAIV